MLCVLQVRPDLRDALTAAVSAVLPVGSVPTSQPPPPPALEAPVGAQYPPAGEGLGLRACSMRAALSPTPPGRRFAIHVFDAHAACRRLTWIRC